MHCALVGDVQLRTEASNRGPQLYLLFNAKGVRRLTTPNRDGTCGWVGTVDPTEDPDKSDKGGPGGAGGGSGVKYSGACGDGYFRGKALRVSK